jgi:ABC-type multidrug transport system ATPase subunit
VWDAINVAKQQAAVVLTTHSMEEADALGDRIGIIVRGRMRVLGGSLTLKQKYGNGYQVGAGGAASKGVFGVRVGVRRGVDRGRRCPRAEAGGAFRPVHGSAAPSPAAMC